MLYTLRILKNTFNFTDVFQKLESKLEPHDSISIKIALGLWKEGESSIKFQYISDKILISNLFEKAFFSIINNQERIETIHEEKKPVSFKL